MGSSTSSFARETAIEKAWVYYIKGDYDKAIDACRALSDEKILGEEARYIMGLSFLKLGDYEEARKNFLFISDNYPGSAIKPEIILGIAEYYKKVIGDFSGNGYSSIAYLKLGESQRKQGKWNEAQESFSIVVRDYPFSLEAETAKEYLQKEEPFYTIQIGVFSKKENAQRLAKILKEKRYDASLEKSYKKDRLVYKVNIGHFNTKEQAEEEASQLRKEGFSAIVYP
jgi:TolA-binding protein